MSKKLAPFILLGIGTFSIFPKFAGAIPCPNPSMLHKHYAIGGSTVTYCNGQRIGSLIVDVFNNGNGAVYPPLKPGEGDSYSVLVRPGNAAVALCTTSGNSRNSPGVQVASGSTEFPTYTASVVPVTFSGPTGSTSKEATAFFDPLNPEDPNFPATLQAFKKLCPNKNWGVSDGRFCDWTTEVYYQRGEQVQPQPVVLCRLDDPSTPDVDECADSAWDPATGTFDPADVFCELVE